MGRDRLLQTVAVALLIFGGLAIVATAASMYAIAHNSYYTCDAQPRPDGSLPYEAGYAGDGTVSFPVAGVRCDWNGVDGTTFSTIIPDVPTTVLGWTAFALPVAGVGLLVARTVAASRRPAGARSDSSS